RKIEIAKLSSGESRRLVSELLAIDNLPNSVRDIILAKSEGNPFFIEEVIRSLMERGLVYKANDRWVADDNIIEVEVPDTIQSVVLERVDRLEAEAKYILQCASVIGRLFKYNLLEHITQKQKELDTYLDEFERRDLAYPERTVPEMEYAFKHALTQEATYQGILEQRKMAFHRNVALGIERIYRERIEQFYEELAHHWEHSGDKEKTLEYLIKSADKAFSEFANGVALKYYTKAIELVEQGIKTSADLGELYTKRGTSNQEFNYYEEAIQDFEMAIKYTKEKNRLVRLYTNIAATHSWAIFNPKLAIEYSDRAMAEIDYSVKLTDNIEIIIDLSMSLVLFRDFELIKSMMDKAMEIAKEINDKPRLAVIYTLSSW
ncbi:MAG: hypothetical protein AAB116_21605, partial [Candidatus Poribacteria bacterium]